MKDYLDGIKGLKINGEFRGNDITFPHPMHFHTVGANTSGDYPFTRFGLSSIDGAGGCNTVANSIRVTPLLVDRPMKVLSYRVSVTATVAGSYIRFAIYKDNGNGYPGAIVQGSDSGDVDASVGGAKVFPFVKTLKPGLYWFARNANAAVTIGTGMGDSTCIPVLGKSPINGARNDNLGFNVTFAFAAYPGIFPTTYTSMLMPIAAQSPMPAVSFQTALDQGVERFNEMNMFGIATLNKQKPNSNITIFSMLQHRVKDKLSYYANTWNGLTGSVTCAANTFRGGGMCINQSISFDEIRVENTSSTGGAAYGVGIYSMRRRSHRVGALIVNTFFPHKLILQVNGFDGTTNGVKSKVIRKTTLSRGLYCVGLIGNATLNYKGVTQADVPSDSPWYRFSYTYGGFPTMVPESVSINPAGASAYPLICFRPA
jgi:hypothetical protein